MLNFFFIKGSGTRFYNKQEIYFSCYILFTGQISLTGCLYVLRHWTICVLYLLTVASRPKMLAINHYQRPKKCPKKLSREDFFYTDF